MLFSCYQYDSVLLCIADLWPEILGEMQPEPLFTTSRIETDIGVHALPVAQLKIFSLSLVNLLVSLFSFRRCNLFLLLTIYEPFLEIY